MKNILIVVDMQNDFIDGALGTREAIAIVPKVEEKIREFEGEVFFTRDTHEACYLETQEGKNLPVRIVFVRQKAGQIRRKLERSERNRADRQGNLWITGVGRKTCFT